MKNLHRIRYPSFIGIGPPRTATTWLHRVLNGHVGLPRGIKETNFFYTNYLLGIDWYLEHFRGYPSDMVVGEIASNYFDCDDAPIRINRSLPGCKLICTLRDPVQRTYSHYRMLQSLGYVGRQPFEKMIAFYLGWQGQGNMVGSSYYALHLKRWMEVFGRDRVLIAFYQDLEEHPQRFIDDITQFIGASRIDLMQSAVGTKKVNLRHQAALRPHLAARVRRLQEALGRHRMYHAARAVGFVFRSCFGRGRKFPSISAETERQLRDLFRSDIEELETLVQRDLGSWKN